MHDLLSLLEIVLVVAGFAVYLLAYQRVISWASVDARRRGTVTAVLVCLAVIFFPTGLVALMAWLIFQPQITTTKAVRGRT